MRSKHPGRLKNGRPRVSLLAGSSFLRATLAIVLAAVSSQVSAVTLVAIAPVSPVFESDGTTSITLRLSRDNPNEVGACSIAGDLATSDLSALAGSDYQAVASTFNLAMTATDPFVEQTVSVNLTDDAIAEIVESFDLNLTPNPNISNCTFPLNLLSPATVDINDDDNGALTVTFNPASITVNEGGGTASLQLDATGFGSVDGSVQIFVDVDTQDITAQSGLDYTTTGVSLVFDAINTSQVITVPIIDDTITEIDEDFQLAINPSSATAVLQGQRSLPVFFGSPSATVTILANDAPGVAQLNANQSFSVNEGDGQYNLILSRVGGSTGTLTAAITLSEDTATAGEDYTDASGTVTWVDGDTTDKTFSITIIDDTLVEGDEDFFASVSAGQSPIVQSIAIIDDDAVAPPVGELAFTSNGFAVDETAGTVAITVERINGTAGAVSVDFLTSDGTATAGSGDYTATAGTLSWLDGEGGAKSINISINADVLAEGGETFSIALSNPQGGVAIGNINIAQVTINDAARSLTEVSGLTPNQLPIAKYIDNVCPRLGNQSSSTEDQLDFLTLCTNLRDPRTTDAQVRTGLDAIGGQQLAAMGVNTLRINRLQHGNLEERFNALHSGASGIDLAGLDLEIQGQVINGEVLEEMLTNLLGGAAGDESFGRWGLFASGKYKFGDKNGSENEAQFDFDVLGVTAGVDYRFKENLVFGVSLGYGSADIDYGGAGGGFEMDSWTASLFGSYFIRDKFYVDALLTVGSNDYDTVRRIVYNDIGGLVDRTATGNTDGDQSSVGIGSGYDFQNGKWTFGPHVGAYYLDVQVDNMRETGAGGLNLTVGDQGSQSFTVNAGGHASYVMTPSWGVLIPFIRFDLVQELQDARELVAIGFVMDPFQNDPSNPSPTIFLQSDKPDESYIVWAVGTSAQFVNGVSGFINYRSTGAWDGFSLDELTLGLRFEKNF